MRRALLVVCLLAAGCGDPPPSYASFKAKLDAGGTCAELFEIRNAIDPKSPDVVTMNRDLRGVGCFSRSSTRKPSQ